MLRDGRGGGGEGGRWVKINTEQEITEKKGIW